VLFFFGCPADPDIPTIPTTPTTPTTPVTPETPETPETPPGTYLVTFDTNGGSTIPAQTIVEGEVATRPEIDPAKDGSFFVDWYADETSTTPYDFDTPVSSALTVYARWNGYVTVTFNTNGGNEVEPQTITEGEVVARPEIDPTKDGSFFVGWYADESLTMPYDFSTSVSNALTVYAKWGGYTNVTDIAAYLASVSGGDRVDNPVAVKVDFNVSTNWASLLTTIQSANKYVALDLSACTMNGTEFDPDNTNATGKGKIVSLILPTAAQSIKDSKNYDNSTFKNFSALKAIHGSTIKSIGTSAFGGGLGNDALVGCGALETADFPQAITIGNIAFYNCYALETADFPQVTSIGNDAFVGCRALTTLNFPQVTTIGNEAFLYCSALTTANFPKAITIGDWAFKYCEALVTADFPQATSIGNSAFSGCSVLTTANFPKAITIGNEAFSSCRALTTANLPQVTSIGDRAFVGCRALTTADFPQATTIGYWAFSFCYALATANLPQVTSIGDRAFVNTRTTSLDIKLGATVPTLGDEIFYSSLSEYSTDGKPVTVKVPSNVTGYNTTWQTKFTNGSSIKLTIETL
jgi:uncharacterized repeat protein (TIGR02543 family)